MYLASTCSLELASRPGRCPVSSRQVPAITLGVIVILLVSERLWPLRPRLRQRGRWVTNALSILMHHSNLRLPLLLDRSIGLLVMTPRLHGIHHSARSAERNSNWSSGLTLWERLHGTFRDDAGASSVSLGVEGVLPATGFVRTLLLPLQHPR